MFASSLQLLTGFDADRRFLLEEDVILIGRDPSCQILLHATTVSRRHVRLMRRGDGYYVEDLGSTAGTKINGQLISMPQRLKDTDLLEIGNQRFKYHTEQPEGKPAAIGEQIVLGERDASDTAEHAHLCHHPQQKLAAIFDLARTLGGGLDLKAVLERVLEVLFTVFPQTERGLVLFESEAGPDSDGNPSA